MIKKIEQTEQQNLKSHNIQVNAIVHTPMNPINKHENNMTHNSEIIDILREYEINEDQHQTYIDEYNKEGRIELPVTNYIEKHSVKILEDIDFKNLFSDIDELTSLININHLSSDSQMRLRTLFTEYYNSFSAFAWDTGKIEPAINIEVTTSESISARPYPIPKVIQPRLSKILNKLIDLNIIEKAKRPSQFINNLLVGKRKSGALRVILDCRLVNQYTKPLNTQFRTQIDILLTIPFNVTHLSSVDLSNA